MCQLTEPVSVAGTAGSISDESGIYQPQTFGASLTDCTGKA